MILHFAEVWTALLLAFVLGCVLGSLLFSTIARSPLAKRQRSLTRGVARFNGALGDRRRPMARAGRPVAVPVEAGETTPVWDFLPDPDEPPVAESEPPSLPPPFEAEGFEGDDFEIEPPEGEEPEEVEPVRARRSWVATTPNRIPPAPSATPRQQPTRAPPQGERPPPSTYPRTALPLATGAAPQPRPLPPPSQERRPMLTGPLDADASGDGLELRRPALLPQPRNGVPDNLQRIRGIGGRNEVRLNELGIFHFSQIAAWTPAEIRWIGQQLAFPERIELDDWVGQAIVLASGGDTGFTKSAERRRARRRNLGDAVTDSEDPSDPEDGPDEES